MLKRLVLLLCSALVGLALSLGAQAQSPAAKPVAQAASGPNAAGASAPRRFDIATQARTGDFDMMLERRVIRFYVPYSRSLYFVDGSAELPPT